MTDDLTQRGKPDRTRINVNERYEVAYWTTVLRVSEEKLKEAVAKVGVMAVDVRKYLGR
jgi:hypothetical protein